MYMAFAAGKVSFAGAWRTILRTKKNIFLLPILFIPLAACGKADLQDYEVAQFIRTLGPSSRFFSANDEGQPLFSATEKYNMVMNGKLDIMSQYVKRAKKKSPAKYEEAAKLAKSEGFETVEAWAEIGDRIMLAYVAIKLKDKIIQYDESMKQMTKEAKKKLPAKFKKILNSTDKLNKTLKEAPQKDIQVVGKYISYIDAEARSSGYDISIDPQP